MASVGSLAVQLVANSDGLSKGIKAAEKRLTAFAQTATGGGLFKSVTAGLGAAGGTVDALFAPLKGLLGTIPLVGGTLASFPTSVGGLAAWFKEGSEAILQTDRVAKKLGVDVSEVGPILSAAGGDSEALTKGLFKLQQRLQGLTEDDKVSTVAFGRLGLTFENFRGKSVTEQIGLIADKINGLPSPTQRAAAAFNLFGKSGAELLPLLSRGSQGIAEAAARMSKLGFGVSAADVESVRQANNALKSIDTAFAGLKRQLAIGLAPAIASLTDSFGTATDAVSHFSETAIDGLEGVIGTLSFLKGAASGLSWKGLIPVVGPGLMGVDMFKAAKESSNKTGEFFNQLRAKIQSKRIEAQLEKDIAGAFNKADQFKNADGLFGPTLNQFGDLADKRAKMMAEAFRKQFGRDPKSMGQNAAGALFDTFEKAHGVIEENLSPLDKFNARFKELSKLSEAGALDFDNYALAVSKAVAELDKANKIELPAAFYQGSSQAISAVNRATVAASTGSAEDRITQLLRQAKEQAEKQTQASRETTKAVQSIFKRGI